MKIKISEDIKTTVIVALVSEIIKTELEIKMLDAMNLDLSLSYAIESRRLKKNRFEEALKVFDVELNKTYVH